MTTMRTEGDEAPDAPKTRALATLRGLPGRLYAVLDAARDPEVLQLLRRSGYRYECLYSGWAANVYGEVAPYLVQLRKDGRLLEQLVERGWGKGWGVFFGARSPFETLAARLRQMTGSWRDGASFLVRYYDPATASILERIEGYLDLLSASGVEATFHDESNPLREHGAAWKEAVRPTNPGVPARTPVWRHIYAEAERSLQEVWLGAICQRLVREVPAWDAEAPDVLRLRVRSWYRRALERGLPDEASQFQFIMMQARLAALKGQGP